MAKTIKTVRTLIERAERKGTAVIRKRGEYGMGYLYNSGVSDLQEVYRVENDGKHVELYHYETLTAKVDIENNKIVSVYGESRSDADSVETFLHELGVENVYFGFRPVNGGFYVEVNGKLFTWDKDGEKAMIDAINEAQK